MAGPVESKADTIEQLRRRMAEIPARSVGPSRLSLAALSHEQHSADPQQSPTAPAASALRTLAVPGPLAELLPHGGLARGSTVHVSGAAALRAGLIASVTGSGGWAALIGSPRLGLLAAAEMGADLRRCALIPEPGQDPVAVAAVVVDGIDLVLLSLGGADIPPSRARSVDARVRRNGAVLIVTDGRWPSVDLRLDARVLGYRGLDAGRGRITGIDLAFEVNARGQRPRRATIAVAGRSGQVEWTTSHSGPVGLRAAQ
ncbi:hypothetical protein RE9431_49030 (plasmid) [Prescottella equi]|uniref:Protein RecA n=1 Tax=Rhodococcus hoagii TaxID=43767 RepID=A0A0F7IFM9_RHOHA|nr:hypothetical protein [Prescottella equi]AKF16048.1 hypothetical protein pVAPN2012_0950 [Prescottella equi]AKG90544.1 hypothetical protein pVAPN_0950 [Prescottella equi]ARX59697.1 hypothetical protein pVAPN1204_0950 [Prescottella equi]ARX59843.1 hypothetical protein pVAPN1354_0950 [Prescottella equi]ARX59990.1 hypothetical protein pVAPN1557_0950 [Prescottella equi]